MSQVGTSQQWRTLDLDEEEIEDNVHQRKKIYDVNNSNPNKKKSGKNLPSNSSGEITIKELNPHQIRPFTSEDKTGGSKTIIIGKPRTGKSRLISSLLYYKKHIFPVGMINSGTEDSTMFYSDIFPDLFVYPKLDTSAIENFIKRQKLAKRHLENQWGVLVIDDCTDNPKTLKTPLFQGIFKNSRQWDMWTILSLQYSMDILPVIRTCVDNSFLLRESSRKNRMKLWENYASIIPTFDDFNDVMDEMTNDFTSIYIDNSVQSNSFDDCLFWYKARLEKLPEKWKFGCQAYHDFSKERYDKSYVNPLVV